ncbi:hypothetical protein FIBSPDRAFT_863711 [Athelia psychrophila]|uniref:Uncharacterized protein n=1 Tax=Athelia psychrophila TaxID=1759441 RepID=A0A166H453_9AGAM|nr:hypothetical protein FIBSPDRAFT_863711 [Fibularhizoctonia sp. CBS 109695]
MGGGNQSDFDSRASLGRILPRLIPARLPSEAPQTPIPDALGPLQNSICQQITDLFVFVVGFGHAPACVAVPTRTPFGMMSAQLRCWVHAYLPTSAPVIFKR